MKNHVIIAVVNDHGTTSTFAKVCRSKSAAVNEARELNHMGLIRMYRCDDNDNFVPASDPRFCCRFSSDCRVTIHVENESGECVNRNGYGACLCHDYCETRDESNCDKVWPELAKRGFVRTA